ncbi:hypothetical protein HYT25_00630 [Candidatus Pacearchaeota archaeon]|nr:hypothetical protein [Candidatus Pacearchaeota archaeon]
MILIVNICKEKLHFYEFVKPIEDILKKKDIKFFTRHYTKIIDKNLKKSSKIIICGTSLKDNEFLNHLDKFQWIKNYKKPVFGICGGAHLIGLVFGEKLKKKKEIGLKKIQTKNFLGINGEKEVYHLHGFHVLSEIYNKENIYGVLFHPEVRNKDIVVNFCRNA